MSGKFARLAMKVLITAGACAAMPAASQAFPLKPIRIIVGNSPGLSGDALARLLAEEMAKVLKQAVIVENKVGAEQAIGMEYVARQMPSDGHTVAMVSNNALAALPALQTSLQFDVLKDLTPVIGVAEGRLALLSSLQAPWKSFDELVAYTQANPGQANYGTANAAWRLLVERMFAKVHLGTNMTAIPFSSGGAAIMGLLGGQIGMVFAGEAQAQQYKGKLRVLAVSGSTRSPELPDVPTFQELGFPNVPMVRYSLAVRSGTPKPALDALHAAAAHALKQPAVRSGIEKLRWSIPSDVSAAQVSRVLADEARIYKDAAAPASSSR